MTIVFRGRGNTVSRHLMREGRTGLRKQSYRKSSLIAPDRTTPEACIRVPTGEAGKYCAHRRKPGKEAPMGIQQNGPRRRFSTTTCRRGVSHYGIPIWIQDLRGFQAVSPEPLLTFPMRDQQDLKR